MRVAISGASGQLGSDLVARLGSQAIPLSHAALDITDPVAVWNTLDRERPHVVINCAAYNMVDRAEDERDLAMLVNQRGPGFLADYCRERDVKLVHISTDYVFDGSTGEHPWTEDDQPLPLGTYALSKYSGEQLVQTHCPRHFVLRTCGLYGRMQNNGKANFVETMLRLGRDRSELAIVNDQICTPTSTAYLASAIVDLIKTESYGLYHATNSGQCSWFDFASEIFRLANLNTRVSPISSEQYNARARRPAYSVLNCARLTSVLGCFNLPWLDVL